MAIPLPITDDVVEACLKCPRKGYLRLTGVAGQPSEYVALQRTLDEEYQPAPPLRTDQDVAVPRPGACPRCGSNDLQARGNHRRTIVDLKPVRGGLKRWVTQYRASSYTCRRCGHVIPPWSDFRTGRPHKYGRTLCGWVAYATVALRVTTEAAADVLGDLFGVRIQRGEVCRQRGFAADRYRATYESILAGLRAGPVVHADETWAQTKRPSARGYVWVFASPTAAAYVYSPSRDGETARTALAGFRGVLVSDFYGGYDGLDCPQQKCLVHLARDLNDELVKNPFDEDLRGLAAGFSALLQGVVGTIDRHGLKAHFLGKHTRDVERFYARHVAVEDGSAAASQFRKRLAARDRGVRRLLVPRDNAREAAVVQEVEVFAVTSLAEAVGLVTGRVEVDRVAYRPEELTDQLNRYDVDFAEVRGQEFAKRALVIAAAGGHNVLMIGAPGSGKSMLSRRLPTILPPLAPAESLDTTRIYSALGQLKPGEALLTTRPFRSPHHTISDAGMVGGGHVPAPGEISMAHNGVLFLDELPEFNRKSLEALRQPLEEGRVTIARASGSTTFPASLMLVAAMNPCPCGYLGDARRPCKCAPMQVEKYLGRVSGPLLDRIDLHVEVPAVPYDELSAKADGTSSAAMRGQVLAARDRQRTRFGGDGRVLNGRMGGRQTRQHCPLDPEAQGVLKSAMEDLGLSARAHDRILRVARTIADLAAADRVDAGHVSEAIGYRTLDRKLWLR